MILSEKGKKIFASGPRIRYFDTLELSHTRFNKVYYLVNDTETHDFNISPYGTDIKTFEPIPLRLELPQVGESQQDLNIVLPNVGYVMVKEIEAAINKPDEPIKLIYRAYDETSTSYIGIIEGLKITSVNITALSITCVATRYDIYNNYVFKEIYGKAWDALQLANW